VAPLASAARTFGVLALLRDRGGAPFDEDARRQLRILSDLASAALQRVTVLAAEREAMEEAQVRARQEAALREAAESLAGAFTAEEVTQRIASSALTVTQARGVFVEQIEPDAEGRPDAVVVRATAGESVPELGSTRPFDGSCTELALRTGELVPLPDLALDDRSCAAASRIDGDCAAVVVPLGDAGAPLGALFVLGSGPTPFLPGDLARTRTFGHLATLAFEKVRLLDEARDARRKLEWVMSSRSRLMRGFSHDVKNPLGAADGHAALLLDGILGDLSAKQEQSVRRIRQSIHHALGLIDDLHELARAETGHLAIAPEPVELTRLVQACGEEYGATVDANGLSMSLDLTLDPLEVTTDPVRVRQIVSNLLSNAIKYTPTGQVTLRVRQQRVGPSAEPGAWAAIDVIDTGVGIPADKRSLIFQEFTRLDGTDKPGAGLGLAISQRLAQALGGQITVRSDLGRGSTFTLWLPLAAPGDRAPPDESGPEGRLSRA
jgi:signal transduction histidine kinase